MAMTGDFTSQTATTVEASSPTSISKRSLRTTLRSKAFFDGCVAIFLLVATVIALLAGEKSLGLVRDEGIYFESGRRYAAWYLDDIPRLGLDAFKDRAIAARFATNREHPALMKSLFGLSKRLFTDELGLMREATGFRFPAILMSGLFSAAIFLFGRRVASRRGAIFAALAFWLIPRTFFHGALSCFDMPIAFAWFLVVACYARAVEGDDGTTKTSWSILTGLSFGFALSIKHNAWIIPGVLLIHWLLAVFPKAWRLKNFRAFTQSIRPFVAILTLGPITLFATWPFLWHHPIERFGWYANFHTQHINYPWEFFGTLLVDGPFPPGYALAVSAVTVPLSLLVLMATGTLFEVVRFTKTLIIVPILRRIYPCETEDNDGHSFPHLDSASLLILGNATASLFVFSMPFVPIFGGVKHWLPAMPFLCILAARSLERIVSLLSIHDADSPRKKHFKSAAFPLLATLTLLPAVQGLIHIHPYGTSFYNEAIGGLPGAANVGMHRQYWSNNVTGVLPWINAHAPKNARVFLHEVTGFAFSDYQRAGMLRDDLKQVRSPEASDVAAYQFMPEFRDVEFRIWNAFGTMNAVTGLYLDETPQVIVYERPTKKE